MYKSDETYSLKKNCKNYKLDYKTSEQYSLKKKNCYLNVKREKGVGKSPAIK